MFSIHYIFLMKKLQKFWLILLLFYLLEFAFRLIQIPSIEHYISDYKNEKLDASMESLDNTNDSAVDEILSPLFIIETEFRKNWKYPKVFKDLWSGVLQEYTRIERNPGEIWIKGYTESKEKNYITKVYPHIIPWQYLLFVKGVQKYIPTQPWSWKDELFVPFDIWLPIRWSGKVYMKKGDYFVKYPFPLWMKFLWDLGNNFVSMVLLYF